MSVFSMPYFGQLYSSCLKDTERTEVFVHTLRLREKILAAGSDLVSTHRGKKVVLVFGAVSNVFPSHSKMKCL